MRGAKRIAAVLMTASLAVSITGCGGEVELDKDAEFVRMNYKVPSSYTDETDGSTALYYQDDQNGIMIFYSDNFDTFTEAYAFYVGDALEPNDTGQTDYRELFDYEVRSFELDEDYHVILFWGDDDCYSVNLTGMNITTDEFLGTVYFDKL